MFGGNGARIAKVFMKLRSSAGIGHDVTAGDLRRGVVIVLIHQIILGKKNGLFKIDLGPVKAMDKRDAVRVGRLLCDEMDRPKWKCKIAAQEC